jgi:hypothetical protein
MRCLFLAIERTENSWVNFYLTEKLRCTISINGLAWNQSVPVASESGGSPHGTGDYRTYSHLFGRTAEF